MNKYLIIFIFTIAIWLCNACDDKPKRKPIYVGEESTTEEVQYARRGDEVIVPFRKQGGVKYVSVKVNGVEFDMIFDTGCSTTLISLAEARYLYEKGKLTQEDILGVSQATIADGSIVDNIMINLKEVVIDDKIVCYNVQAQVSSNVSAPLLLGNDVLDRTASVTVDNDNQVIKFTIK